MPSTGAKSDHISNMRTVYEKILDADSELAALLNEANDNGYTFSNADFVDGNAGILASDYTTALTQAANWHTALSAGFTNLPTGIRALFSKVAK
jgi:hypothetical protein